MFQTYKNLSQPETAQGRVEKLREQFASRAIDALLIPKSDEYLGEYIPDCAERLAWVTSFTGSAGAALILKDNAVIFTDGRYRSQVRSQCDHDLFDFCDSVSNPPETWIAKQAPEGLILGVDAWTLPSAHIEKLQESLEKIGGKIVCLDDNLVDAVWLDQPAPPKTAIEIQPLTLSGQMAQDKIKILKAQLKADGQDAFVMADPTSIAWMFNIRGNDVAHTPVLLSRAIIYADQQPDLFLDLSEDHQGAHNELLSFCNIKALGAFDTTLRELGARAAITALDAQTSSHAISMILKQSGAVVHAKTDPAIKARAIKNQAEIKGARTSHLQDGVAMVAFLAWLDAKDPGTLDEIKVAQKLEQCRIDTGLRLNNPLRDISFDTISGSGPNAAIIHYRVDEQSNRKLQTGEMILIDSGGQYVTGTTDITRTIALGAVSDEQKRFFTLVLKGMIELSMLRFPEKTRGVDIDILARAALWQAGVDYAHGTGHGVGSYLSVHEGPQSISRRAMVELKTGMILSNEPGYYRDGAFGIRIENLILVTEPEDIEGGEQKMHAFETLTLCPIDRSLILPELLTSAQLDWLNTYHARVLSDIGPLIEDVETKDWLIKATSAM